MLDSTLSATASKSAKKCPAEKPKKPHPDFPLFAHATGRWAKKVCGKLEYFGPWRDPDGALAEWLRVKDDLLAGRKPRPASDGFTLADLCNRFLIAKKTKVKTRSWQEYKKSCENILAVMGRNRLVDDLQPEDFSALREHISDGKRPKTVHGEVGRVRVILNFAYKNALIDIPVRWGMHFDKPSKREIRLDQARQAHLGQKDLNAEQINELLKLASPEMKAMILLGVNVGMGNEDVARLEFRHFNLESGTLDFPRPKTGVRRRAVLWAETIQAIINVVKTRNEPDERLNQYVFITKYSQTWFKDTSSNPISAEFSKLRPRWLVSIEAEERFFAARSNLADQVPTKPRRSKPKTEFV